MLMDHLGEIQRLKQVIMLYEKRNIESNKFKIKSVNQKSTKFPKNLKRSKTSAKFIKSKQSSVMKSKKS